jgi:glycosyltransferase involved in cell wall biosynthesis
VDVPSTELRCAWRGDFGSGHSLAVVNDGVTQALERAGWTVARLGATARLVDDDAIGIAQHWPPSFEAPTKGPFVLYQPWEFGAVPAAWADEIRRRVDEVWTPSRAAREAFVRSGVSPDLVHVLPNGIDPGRFDPDGPKAALPTRARTVFLFVGGLVHRKGIDVLLEAFGRAFDADDDVALVVKSFGNGTFYDGDAGLELLRRFRSTPGAPELVILDDQLDHDGVAALYRAADAVVQPYRGEGFCLPALEALASGVPPIVTAGGPTDDFVTGDCGWLIESTRAPLPPGSLPPRLALRGEGFMLEPDVSSLVDALREAADPAARAARAAEARDHALALSWDAVGAIAARRLEALARRTPIRRVAEADVPGRRGHLFAAGDDWPDALRAYARAFDADADTTLVLPEREQERVIAELAAAGIDPDELADVVVADGGIDPVGLDLAADTVITTRAGRTRARRVVSPDPAALRAAIT